MSELSPDTVTHVVEGGSGLGTIMVSTCLVNFGLKYLHFVGRLLSELTHGGDVLSVVRVNSDEALEGTIGIGGDITLVTVVVLRSVARSLGSVGLSRPWLNIDSFLNDVADGGTNGVGTLTISAGDVRSLVNEVTVGELSSNVEELGSLGGFLVLSSGFARVSQNTIVVGNEITFVASVSLRGGGSTTSSRPGLNINSLLGNIANMGADTSGTGTSSASNILSGLLDSIDGFLTPDTGSLVEEDGSEVLGLLLLSVESGVLSVDDGIDKRNLLSGWAKILGGLLLILGSISGGGLLIEISLLTGGLTNLNGRDGSK